MSISFRHRRTNPNTSNNTDTHPLSVNKRTMTDSTSFSKVPVEDPTTEGEFDNHNNNLNGSSNGSKIDGTILNDGISNGGDFQSMDVEMSTEKENNSHPLGGRPITLKALLSYSFWHDFLFPPSVPRECQLLRCENLAIPCCYLLVGLLQGFGAPLVNVYPLDLGATEAQQTSLSALRSLPASFKIIFGFLSDNFPLLGYRRKSYMFFGWFLASSSIGMLLLSSNTNLETDHHSCFVQEDPITQTSTTSPSIVVPDDAPSIPMLSLCLFGASLGLWFADVMGDSLVAEKAKLEPVHSRGGIQSSCYAYRFFGSMISVPMSTYLYNQYGPKVIFYVMSALPLLVLPIVLLFGEVKNLPVASTAEQCSEIYKTVCSRAVWQPMGFVYLYNVLQIGNAAWREFLKTGLHFTTCQLNLILIMAYVLLYCGILCYKYYMIHWSWRKVYILTTMLNGLFSFLQLFLILGITFGVSNFLFALGDDAFMEFIGGIQFLPTTIMMVHLCPSGSEGASYAMFTTVNNSALSLSSSISTMLLGIWDVSKATLASHNYNGMLYLTILTTCLQMSGILFVNWLPTHKEELEHLHKAKGSSNKLGGTIFLTITVGSILYAVGVSILNIVAPGWMGES